MKFRLTVNCRARHGLLGSACDQSARWNGMEINRPKFLGLEQVCRASPPILLNCWVSTLFSRLSTLLTDSRTRHSDAHRLWRHGRCWWRKVINRPNHRLKNPEIYPLRLSCCSSLLRRWFWIHGCRYVVADYLTLPTSTTARGYGTVDQLKAEVDIARSVLGVTSQSILPVGVGYLCWKLEQPGIQALDYLDVALDNKVQAVWLSFGERIADWITHIRGKEPTPGAIKIFVQVSTVEQALAALKDWKADVVVAQGLLFLFLLPSHS